MWESVTVFEKFMDKVERSRRRQVKSAKNQRKKKSTQKLHTQSELNFFSVKEMVCQQIHTHAEYKHQQKASLVSICISRPNIINVPFTNYTFKFCVFGSFFLFIFFVDNSFHFSYTHSLHFVNFSILRDCWLRFQISRVKNKFLWFLIVWVA